MTYHSTSARIVFIPLLITAKSYKIEKQWRREKRESDNIYMKIYSQIYKKVRIHTMNSSNCKKNKKKNK